MLHFSSKSTAAFLTEEELALLDEQLKVAQRFILERNGAGSDFLGWVDHPIQYDREELFRIQVAAARIQEEVDVLVVIGIGGSYLGARAVIEALKPAFGPLKNGVEVIFAGCNLSSSYMVDLLRYLEGKRFAINVISKSGTTTEPAIAFRVLRAALEKQVGKEAAKRLIFATTDAAKGALKGLSDREGYETFVVPDDIGGRYSVLSAVGLLPIAAAGFNPQALLDGAAKGRDLWLEDIHSDPYRYAACRNVLLRKGYTTEILVNYEPSLHYISEWWKQLYGESEGKNGRGLFPASVDNTADLHSMGQYIQEGRRFLFETVLWVKAAREQLTIETDEENLDGLNFLAGMNLHEVNEKAMQGTVLAHVDGQVPNFKLSLDRLDEENLGALIYFYELACGVSAYLNAVNPFDQPGVEAYKKNMFALLGKPGYEAEQKALLARLEE